MSLFFAHRGATNWYLENTIDAFVIAVEEGYDGIELDVRSTKDGHLIIYHDPIIQRNVQKHLPNDNIIHGDNMHCLSWTCQLENRNNRNKKKNVIGQKVKNLTLEQIQSIKLIDQFSRTYHIPTLKEVLTHPTICNSNIILNIEIKDKPSAIPVVDLLYKIVTKGHWSTINDQTLKDRTRLVLTSFEHKIIDLVKLRHRVYIDHLSFINHNSNKIIQTWEKIKIGQLIDPSLLGLNTPLFQGIIKNNCFCSSLLKSNFRRNIKRKIEEWTEDKYNVNNHVNNSEKLIVLEDTLVDMLDCIGLIEEINDKYEIWIYSTAHQPMVENLFWWKYGHLCNALIVNQKVL